jgi:hypothetical protein
VFSCRLSTGLFHEGVVNPVGLSAELQEPAMVHNSVNDGGSHVVIAEHGSPPGELQVCGDDQAAFSVAVRYDLEEQPGSFGIDRQVSQFVNYEDLVFGQCREFPVKALFVLNLCRCMTRDEVVKNLACSPCRLRCAVALADEAGIGSLTIRSLAQARGAKPMSLYHYVANKGEILDGIVDLVFSEIELPSTGGRRCTGVPTPFGRY